MRVLIADGDARVRQALAALLQVDGSLNVVGAVATATAVHAIVARARPDVIVLDLRLPNDTDGLALVRELSASDAARVIAMSASGALRDAALRAGADAFLEKGDDPARVLSLLRGTHGGA
jgi:DNA-binding NarL/FixJ family response regulator